MHDDRTSESYPIICSRGRAVGIALKTSKFIASVFKVVVSGGISAAEEYSKQVFLDNKKTDEVNKTKVFVEGFMGSVTEIGNAGIDCTQELFGVKDSIDTILFETMVNPIRDMINFDAQLSMATPNYDGNTNFYIYY